MLSPASYRERHERGELILVPRTFAQDPLAMTRCRSYVIGSGDRGLCRVLPSSGPHL